MLKKTFIFTLAFLLIFPSVFLFSGCLNTTKEYQISVLCKVTNTQNSTMGKVYGSGTYAENEQIIIVAVANEGYEFVKWDDGDTNSIRTITILKNDTFKAEFRNVTKKYALESIEVGVFDLESKVENILLQNLYIEAEQGDINCIDLISGLSANYLGNDGISLYNEDKSGYIKHYNQYNYLKLYVERNENNIFTSEEYIRIYFQTFEGYDDTVSSDGTKKSSFEYVQINPQTTLNVFDINLINSKMVVKLNFVEV